MKNSYGGYCPYLFFIDYKFKTQSDITFINYWSISKIYASGDKTDLYVLFANTMAIVLKVFDKTVFIDYVSPLDSLEVNEATILFDEVHRNVDLASMIEFVKNFFHYI